MKKIIMFSLMIILSGCTAIMNNLPLYNVTINSFSSGEEIVNKKYILLPENPNINPNSLEFKSYSKNIEILLSTKGYEKAEKAEDANVLIGFSYYLSPPQTKVVSNPEYDWVTDGYNTTSVLHGNTVHSTTSPNKSLEVVGYKTESEIYYIRSMKLTAIDVSKGLNKDNPNTLWTTYTESIGSSNDLRTILKLMSALTEDFINVDSGSKKSFNVAWEDERILKYKQ